MCFRERTEAQKKGEVRGRTGRAAPASSWSSAWAGAEEQS